MPFLNIIFWIVAKQAGRAFNFKQDFLKNTVMNYPERRLILSLVINMKNTPRR